MTNDLASGLRRYVDSQPPVTVEEILGGREHPRPSPTRSANVPRGAVVGAALAVLAAAVTLIAVVVTGTLTRAGHSTHVLTGPGLRVSPSVPAPAPSGPPYTGCKWTVPQWDPSAPASIQAQPSPPGYWSCPPNAAEAAKVLGVAVPDPTLPAGWAQWTATLDYLPPATGAPGEWTYIRSYALGGRIPADTAGEQWLGLRVSRPAHGRSPEDPAGPLVLANGSRVTGSLGQTGSVDLLTWDHAGVVYGLSTVGLDRSQVMAAANSLP